MNARKGPVFGRERGKKGTLNAAWRRLLFFFPRSLPSPFGEAQKETESPRFIINPNISFPPHQVDPPFRRSATPPSLPSARLRGRFQPPCEAAPGKWSVKWLGFCWLAGGPCQLIYGAAVVSSGLHTYKYTKGRGGGGQRERGGFGPLRQTMWVWDFGNRKCNSASSSLYIESAETIFSWEGSWIWIFGRWMRVQTVLTFKRRRVTVPEFGLHWPELLFWCSDAHDRHWMFTADSVWAEASFIWGKLGCSKVQILIQSNPGIWTYLFLSFRKTFLLVLPVFVHKHQYILLI